MACMCCLDKCLPEDPFDNFQEDPLVDLQKVIEKCAWEQVRLVPPPLTWRERLCKLEKVVTLEVDKSFLGIQPADRMKLTPRSQVEDSTLDVPAGQPSKNTVLFQSRFRNDTAQTQIYSFKTERQTKSTLELSLQRGFTFGQNLELDIKIPTGIEDCEVSGKLSSQLQWSFQRGKITREENQVTWAVDSQIAVSPNNVGEAALRVRECRWTADFKMPCRIRPRTEDGKIAVFVRRKKTGDLLQIVSIPCKDVVDECPNSFSLVQDQADRYIMCDLKGTCHTVCAVEQEIWLKEAKLISRQPELMSP